MSEFKPLSLEGSQYLSYLLPKVQLRDYQVRATVHMAVQDTQILAFDTGLGKTLTAVAGLVAKRRYTEENFKTIYLCPLKGLNQVYETFKKYSTLRAVKLSGKDADLKSFIRDFETDIDVLLVNYEAFDNPLTLRVLHQLTLTKTFKCIIADEAHTFSNIHKSSRNFFIGTLITKMDYRYLLTATPIISDKRQYGNLIALTKGELEGLSQINSAVMAGSYTHEQAPNFVQFKERDTSYIAELHRVDNEGDIYGSTYGTEIFKYTRGRNNIHVEKKLIELITNAKRKLLIYSHLTVHHAYLREIAESLGRKVGVISGSTDTRDQGRFNNNEIDCVIFSVPTELNLPADEIIMYDWTSLAHQAIGRGIRSFQVDNYKAHFIVTTEPKEVSLFQNTVLKNAMYLKEAFGKDIEQILELEEKYGGKPDTK